MSSHELPTNVLSHLSQFKPFRKSSKASKEALAYDVSLIALSIRTGYLVDVVRVPENLAEQTYSSLLSELSIISESFNNILHLYEPSANQSFLVHKSLLLEKLEALLYNYTNSSYPVFIHLPEKGDTHQLDAIPLPLLEVLQFLLDSLRLHVTNTASGLHASLQLPDNLPSTTLIPLAAVLLDYPVAYVPASESQTSFLSGVPLVLYRCRICLHHPPPAGGDDADEQHILLQFSCPAILGSDTSSPTSIHHIVTHLESTFQPRIAQSLPDSTFYVAHEHVTLDRVAL